MVKENKIEKKLQQLNCLFYPIGSRQEGHAFFYSDVDYLIMAKDKEAKTQAEKLSKKIFNLDFHIYDIDKINQINFNQNQFLTLLDSIYRFDLKIPQFQDKEEYKIFVHLWSYLSSLSNFLDLYKTEKYIHGVDTLYDENKHFKFLYNFKFRKENLFNKDPDLFFNTKVNLSKASDFFHFLVKKKFLLDHQEIKDHEKYLKDEFQLEFDHYRKLKDLSFQYLKKINQDSQQSYIQQLDIIENQIN